MGWWMCWHGQCFFKAMMSGMVAGLFENPTLKSMELALDARAVRHEAIASNLANVNTPGYKRVDLAKGFEAEYTRVLAELDGGNLRVQKPNVQVEESSVHGKVRKDGNNVSLEQEVVALMNNRLEYEFATEMVSRSFKGLKRAIGGSGGG